MKAGINYYSYAMFNRACAGMKKGIESGQLKTRPAL